MDWVPNWRKSWSRHKTTIKLLEIFFGVKWQMDVRVNLIVSQPYTNHIAEMILKRSLLAYIVILFFGDVAIYLSLGVSPRLEPQYWIALLVVLAGILAWFSRQTRWEVFRTPVFFWCVGFLALTLIFFAAIPTSHIEQLKERIRDVVLLTTFLSVFLMLRDELLFLRKLVFWAVLFGVVMNLISIAHTNFFMPQDFVGTAQPAGFYINPNESGTALISGMILSVSILAMRWRIPYAAFVFIGVLATFSREAIVAWALVVFCLCFFGIMEWKKLLLWTGVLVIVAVAATLGMIKTHVINTHLTNFYYDQLHRLIWFVHTPRPGSSVGIRLQLLKNGWELFLAHPWIGNGLGSTYHWVMPFSTHNMYLLYMDDYGVIGFFLYPLLIWCMVRGAAGETRKLAWTMAIFLLFWGLFDHNIVQNYYSLFAISLTAAMSRISATASTPRTEAIPAEAGTG